MENQMSDVLIDVYKRALIRCNFNIEEEPTSDEYIPHLVLDEMIEILKTDSRTNIERNLLSRLLELLPEKTEAFVSDYDITGNTLMKKYNPYDPLPLIIEGVSCVGKSTALLDQLKYSSSLDLITMREDEKECNWLSPSSHNSFYVANLFCKLMSELKSGKVFFDRGPISCLMYQGLKMADGFTASPFEFINSFIVWWNNQLPQLGAIDMKLRSHVRTTVVLRKDIKRSSGLTTNRAAVNSSYSFELDFNLHNYAANQFIMFLLYAVVFNHPILLVD